MVVTRAMVRRGTRLAVPYAKRLYNSARGLPYQVGTGIASAIAKRFTKQIARTSTSRAIDYAWKGSRKRKRGPPPNRINKKIRRIATAVVRKEESKDKQQGKFHYFADTVDAVQLLNKQIPNANNGITQLDFFTPAQIADAAAIMYKGKTSSNNGGNFVASNANNFDSNCKIHVRKGWGTITVKNNTLQSGTILMYECKPKGDYQGTSGTLATGPLQVWEQGLAGYTMQTNGVYALATTQYLNDTPEKYSQFNEMYNAKCTKKHLAPGQSANIHVSMGDRVLDFTNYYTAATDPFYKYAINGLSRHCFYIWRPDPNNGYTDKTIVARYAFRAAPAASSDSGTLLVNYQYGYTIEVPDETATASRHNVISRNMWTAAPGAAETSNSVEAYKMIPGILRTN